MLKLKETNHPYYCEMYSTQFLQEYDNWNEFKDAFGLAPIDHDMNYVIRFDLHKYDMDESGTKRDDYYVLKLFYMQQRRGRYVPVIVNNIEEKDIEEINAYLMGCYKYIKTLWKEFE